FGGAKTPFTGTLCSTGRLVCGKCDVDEEGSCLAFDSPSGEGEERRRSIIKHLETEQFLASVEA
ncbi:hypothetical protein, partial [Novipirellula artificiosorum]|uniref:hypothetical protein n=1 Tax=Novipirellula artificiosorum TaxID=2528016 RepID=UPI001E5061E7